MREMRYIVAVEILHSHEQLAQGVERDEIRGPYRNGNEQKEYAGIREQHGESQQHAEYRSRRSDCNAGIINQFFELQQIRRADMPGGHGLQIRGQSADVAAGKHLVYRRDHGVNVNRPRYLLYDAGANACYEIIYQELFTAPKIFDVLAEHPQTEHVEKNVPQPSQTFVADTSSYEIIGTETTHILAEGETLTRVALKYYGTKSLWPYLVKHNPKAIKNPDNVPYGTIIKIPKLSKKK